MYRPGPRGPYFAYGPRWHAVRTIPLVSALIERCDADNPSGAFALTACVDWHAG